MRADGVSSLAPDIHKIISGVYDMFAFTAVLSVLLTAVMIVTVIYKSSGDDTIDERNGNSGRRNLRNHISE